MFADLLTFTSRGAFVTLTTPVGAEIRLPHCPQRLVAESAKRSRADV